MHVHMSIFKNTYERIHVYIHTQTNERTHTRVQTLVYIQIGMNVYVMRCVRARTYISTHTYVR